MVYDLSVLCVCIRAFLGEPGSSLFIFTKKGILDIKTPDTEDDMFQLAVEMEAEDVTHDPDTGVTTIICSTDELPRIHKKISTMDKFRLLSSSYEYLAHSYISLDENTYMQAKNLMDDLQNHPDVVRVFKNFILSQ